MQSLARAAVLVGMCARLLHADTISVTDCSQLVVSTGDTAVLQNDVTCVAPPPNTPGPTPPYLQTGTRLDLNGFSLFLQLLDGGIWCEGGCEVRGPGAVVGDGSVAVGIRVIDQGKLKIRDIAINGVTYGIFAPAATVKATNTTITADRFGISASKQVKLDNVSITLASVGGFGVDTIRFGEEVPRGFVTGRTVHLSGCNQGIYATRRVRIDGLTFVGVPSPSGFGVGVYAGKSIMLMNSSVTGGEYRDLVSSVRPQLVATACDRSGRREPTGDGAYVMTGYWGVCANDLP